MGHMGPWYATVAPENKYLYNGKELNEDYGANLYEYGARWYDPVLGRFTGVDPMADQRSWMTPYNYVQNNPILRIDPDGALDSPIFDKDGNFLGVDSEGYSGDIVVMRAETYNALTNNGQETLDHSLTEKLVGTGNSFFAANLNDAGISVGAYSNVLTHVTEQLSGESFDGTTLDFSQLEGGKIQIANEVVDEDGFVVRELHGTATNPASQHAGTLRRDNGDINVTAVLRYGRNEDFGTVENVQNILGIHEYYRHGVKGLSAKSASEHRQVYRLQTQHRTYKKVTPSVIDLIKTGLE